MTFQSAPDAFAPGDRGRGVRAGVFRCFNPRPTLSRRATGRLLYVLDSKEKFQSAPDAFAPGDTRTLKPSPRSSMFQSAPDAFAPGDRAIREQCIQFNVFQSAPDAFAPGDCGCRKPNSHLLFVPYFRDTANIYRFFRI